MKAKFAMVGIALIGMTVATGTAQAQDHNYTLGTVWTFSQIKTEPGEFENYMDYLDGNYKKINEFLKKEGPVVSYHIFNINNARNDEPDLILAIEYKDYSTTADRAAIEKKVEALVSADAHKQEKDSGDRKSMRKLMGSVEAQELKLK
jgi:hypothetical protein